MRRGMFALSLALLILAVASLLSGQTPVPLEPYCFVVPTTGTYQLWHRVIAKDGNSDSFFASINGAAEFIDDACEQHWPCDGTFWTPLTHRTSAGLPTTVPYKLHLTKGQSLTVSLRVREVGIQLVQIGAGTNPPGGV